LYIISFVLLCQCFCTDLHPLFLLTSLQSPFITRYYTLYLLTITFITITTRYEPGPAPSYPRSSSTCIFDRTLHFKLQQWQPATRRSSTKVSSRSDWRANVTAIPKSLKAFEIVTGEEQPPNHQAAYLSTTKQGEPKPRDSSGSRSARRIDNALRVSMTQRRCGISRRTNSTVLPRRLAAPNEHESSI